MSNLAIKAENISKLYRLGVVGSSTLGEDLTRFWAAIRGREDPYLKLATENDRSRKAISDYVWALKDIDFEIKTGEAVGVIGNNGAGKSTLLKILSKITKPTTGNIKISGRIASLLEVGTGFKPELTGRQNIFMNGAILGMSNAEVRRKLDEIIDFSGIEGYIDTPVKRYSSGMYIRLAFAVAAHLEPEILIVDEVLAVGDVEFQKKCLGKMQDVNKGEGRTVLFVSHNMQAISTLTQKLILLEYGKLKEIGETGKVIDTYLSSNISSDLIYEKKELPDHPVLVKAEIVTSKPSNVHENMKSIEFKFRIHVPQPLQGAAFAFHVKNSSEAQIVHAWNFDSMQPFGRESGFYDLTYKIPAFRLYMGKYTINTHIADYSTGKFFEAVHDICPFEVVMYGKPRPEYNWDPKACAYTEEGDWYIQKCNN